MNLLCWNCRLLESDSTVGEPSLVSEVLPTLLPLLE
jgi:hypothetical protein